MNTVYTLEKIERKYDTTQLTIRHSIKYTIYKNIFIIDLLCTYIYTHISKEHLKIRTYSVTVSVLKKKQFLSTDICAETTQMLKDILENKNTHSLIHTRGNTNKWHYIPKVQPFLSL